VIRFVGMAEVVGMGNLRRVAEVVGVGNLHRAAELVDIPDFVRYEILFSDGWCANLWVGSL
jgi:hypothetical protein